MTDLLTPPGTPARVPTSPATARRTPARNGALMALVAMTSVQLGLAVSVGLVDVIGVTGAAWLRLSVAALVLLAVVRPRRAHFTRESLGTTLALGVATGGSRCCSWPPSSGCRWARRARWSSSVRSGSRSSVAVAPPASSRCWRWSGCCC